VAQRKYRVGFIGCGSTSRFSLEGWRNWPDEVEVTALCDTAPEQIKARKTDFPELCGKAHEYGDYRRMLAEEPLDIVTLCAYGDTRLEHTEACLRAGKHVLMEKPVGHNLEEARRFRHLARQHPDLKAAVCYSLRYHKPFLALKALIERGVLGRIISGEISYSHPHDFSREAEGAHVPRGLRTTDRGGNYIASSQLTRATHPWDMARYLLGEVTDVFAARARCHMGILWMESGALCHVLAGSVTRGDGVHHQPQLAQIHGTEGSAWMVRDLQKPFENRTIYRTHGEVQTAPDVTHVPESSHGAVFRARNLLDAIEGKAQLVCSMEDGAKTTELLHAIWLSERLQVKVRVMPAEHTG